MNVYLEVSHNKANIKRVVLKKTAILGRSKECNLRIASTQVSRRHCQVTVENEGVFVMDLKSSNGTFLNGKPLPANQRVQVTSGSELAIGPARFVFRFDGPPGVVAGPGSTVDGKSEMETHSPSTSETVGDTVREGTAPEDFLEFLAAGADTVEEVPEEFLPVGNGSAVGRPLPGMSQSEPDSSPALPEEPALEGTINIIPSQDSPPEAFELNLGDDIDDASASEIAAFTGPVAEESEEQPVLADEAIPAAVPIEDEAEDTLEGFSMSEEAEEPPPAPQKSSKVPAPQQKPAKTPAPQKSDDQIAFDFLNDAGEGTGAADDSSLGDFFSQFDK